MRLSKDEEGGLRALAEHTQESGHAIISVVCLKQLLGEIDALRAERDQARVECAEIAQEVADECGGNHHARIAAIAVRDSIMPQPVVDDPLA